MQLRLSATSVRDFKACPELFRLKYVEGVRPIEDTDSLRVGTNWHELMEVLGRGGGLTDCVRVLNERYERLPDGRPLEAWSVERASLAAMVAGYVWYHQDDPFTMIATEQRFELPLREPRSRMALPTDEVVRVGRIDKTVLRNSRPMVVEHKTTSKPVDPDAPWWKRLRLDTQISFYALAGRDMGLDVGGTLYDVARKPTISPRWLTIAESRAFLESGRWCETQFEIAHHGINCDGLAADGWALETKDTAKGEIQVRESPEMFGARLLLDIYERPGYYFARREISRTDDELARFEAQLYSIYQAIRYQQRSGHWFLNEHNCDATYPCPFIPICWNGRSADDPGAGFTKLTVKETA